MKSKGLTIEIEKGKKKEDEAARILMSPALRHSLTSNFFTTTIGGREELDPASTRIEYERRISNVKSDDMTDIEATLVAQTVTLDAIFNEMAYRSAVNMGEYLPATETYMRMALKAQAQCRNTIEALNEMKNPKTVTISKQANISGQQIVNNGTMNTEASRTGKNVKQSNELLEEIDNERLDTGTTGETIKANQTMEAVGTVNRRKNSTGES